MNCPHCNRLLYSRQHRKCGYCGGELPEEFRLTKVEIADLRREQEEIENRRIAAKEKEEKEKEENQRSGGDDSDLGLPLF